MSTIINRSNHHHYKTSPSSRGQQQPTEIPTKPRSRRSFYHSFSPSSSSVWSVIVTLLSVEILCMACFQYLIYTALLQEEKEEGGEALPSKPNIRSRRHKHAFVCITGQIQRLELHNKVDTILHPLRAAGWEPHIALLVTDDPSALYYSNRGNQVEDRAFANFTQAQNYLKQQGYTVVNQEALLQPVDPWVNPEYLNLVRRKEGTDHWTRIQGHVRQFHTLTRCGQEMIMTGRQNYDWAIRVREDVGLTKPLEVEPLYHELYEPSTWSRLLLLLLLGWNYNPNPTILVTDCRGHEGMNDRLAIVSQQAAYHYFLAPFRDGYITPLVSNDTYVTYLWHQLKRIVGYDDDNVNATTTTTTSYTTTTSIKRSRQIINPESYLYSIYHDNHNIDIVETNSLRFVVKLEPTPDGSFVLVHGEDKTFCNNNNARHNIALPNYILDNKTATQFL